MPPQPLYNVRDYDFDHPIFTLDDIRRVNPQRHEMEQLSGVVYVDREKHGAVGYKDAMPARGEDSIEVSGDTY